MGSRRNLSVIAAALPCALAACSAGANEDRPPAKSTPPAASATLPLTAARLAALEASIASGAATSDPLAAPLARLHEAMDLLAKADGVKAAAVLDDPALAQLPLAAHVSRARAEALMLQSRLDDAAAQIDAALASDPPADLAIVLMTKELDLAKGRGKAPETAARIGHAIASLRDVEGKPALLLAVAETLIDAQKKDDALPLLREIAVSWPTCDESSEAEDLLATVARDLKTPPFSGEDRLARARVFLKEGRNISLKKEITELRKIAGYSPPGADQEVLAKAWGHALLMTEAESDAVGALKSYEHAAATDPDAVYDLAAAYGKLGDSARKSALLRSILDAASADDAPERRAVREKVIAELGAGLEMGGDRAKASALYLEAADLLKGSSRTDEYLFRGGWLAWALGDRERALAAWGREIDAYPDSSVTPSALYWRGCVLRDAGDKEGGGRDLALVASRFPTSYYGKLASALAAATGPPASPAQPVPPDVLSYRDHALELGVRAPRALLLRAAGLPEPALMEAAELAAEHPESLAATTLYATALRGTGKNQRARDLLRQAAPPIARLPKSELPAELWDVLYPLSYRDLLMKAAKEQSLPPSLLFGLVYQESTFEPDATSRSGAMGLMQLMPGTASDMAQALKVASYADARAYEPELNVAMGSTYFARVLRQCGSSVERALAGYNGGPARTEGYWALVSSKDIPTFIESIPIKETRLYVKKVLEAKAEYERVHGVSGAP
ncbi:MAG: transglycosylase SLT domain-containing protein [Acidobacteriota bacterium]